MVLRITSLLLVFCCLFVTKSPAQEESEELLTRAKLDSILNEFNQIETDFQSEQEVYENEKVNERNFWMTLFGLIAVGGIIYMKVREKRRFDHLWQKDVFNKKRPLKQDHLLEAYLRLGVKMITEDRVDIGEKLSYLNNYLRKYFPNSSYDFEEILKSAYRNPISLIIVAKWLNHHLKDASQKSQLIYFLAGLSIIDGSIEPREEKMLYDLGELLNLSVADIRSVVNMYQKNRENTHQQNTTQSEKLKLLELVEQASLVLNVSINAGIEEIKKAYRSMVKIHHPDRFMDQPEEQQKIAHERFLHIQKAYELLENFKSTK